MSDVFSRVFTLEVDGRPTLAFEAILVSAAVAVASFTAHETISLTQHNRSYCRHYLAI
jgi:hypothetical protein